MELKALQHGKIGAPPATSRQASQQFEQIRQRLSSALKIVDELVGMPAPAPGDHPVDARAVQELIKLRRNRDRFFDGELFADPAWDILLELYAAHLAQLRTSVSSLCHGAAVPPTTALRWIANLEEKGLIARSPDPMDGRRFFVSLTADGLQRIEDYFRTVPRGNPPI